MFSVRFQRPVRLTIHACERMVERGIPEALLLEVIETGTLKHKDERHAWLFKHCPDRADNLICAAVVIGEAIIVKTVMHHFQPEG